MSILSRANLNVSNVLDFSTSGTEHYATHIIYELNFSDRFFPDDNVLSFLSSALENQTFHQKSKQCFFE